MLGEQRAAHRATAPSKWMPSSSRATEAQDQALLRDGHRRLVWASAILAGCMGLLMIRAAWIMGRPHAEIESRIRNLFTVATERRGARGDLLDRNGRVLATTVKLPSLYANPQLMTEDALARWMPDIVALTGKDEATIREKIAMGPGQKRQEVRLGNSLDPDQAVAFQKKWNAWLKELRKAKTPLEYPYFWVEQEPVRVYPGRELAAPMLGFVDALESGGAGLEKLLDRDLRGENYRILVERDRRGFSVSAGADDSRLARDGRSVHLTLDASIQAATEEALLRAVMASQPAAAMAVVTDVRTGGILAVANWPSGNPNDLAARGNQELFKNHAVVDQIEPGSVMKPFVVAAAMQEGLTRPEDRIDCKMGRWQVADKVIRDDHPKGVLTVTEIIKYSSNIGTGQIGLLLGPQRLMRYLKDFGFGRRTGLGFAGETGGSLRNPETARPVEIVTTSFGQGMTATPVQLAAAMAALGNGGMRMHPYLVDATVESGVLTQREPREDRQVVSREVAASVVEMMETVIEDGTGTKAAVEGYRVAGKTGTAQKVENGVYSATARIGSFVGLIPADRPEIAVSISIDTPTVGSKYGGIVAAPAFSEIGGFTMRYLGIAPGEPRPRPVVTDESGQPVPTVTPKKKPLTQPPPALAPLAIETVDGTPVMPDLRGHTLREIAAGLRAAGYRVDLQGQGSLVEQIPAPGTPLTPGQTLTVRFQ
jgi:cell division protein FtsI (penicillin-binding protein 3)